jgi:hypothetical protein
LRDWRTARTEVPSGDSFAPEELLPSWIAPLPSLNADHSTGGLRLGWVV